MKTQIKEINSFTRSLEVTVHWSDLEQKFNQEFKKFKSKIALPGFRKGKVPENLVKANYGKSFEVDFVEQSMDNYFRQALQENNLNPINKAEIKELDFNEGTDLVFTADFEVVPEFSLPKYKKIKINVTRYTPTETDLQQSLDELRERYASLKTIDSGAESGMYVECDLQELDEQGLAIVGSKQEKRFVRLGEGYFKGNAEETLIGINTGEERVVEVTMDDDRKIKYQITAHKIQELIKPDLDDDFAKSCDNNVETLEELKSSLQERITESLDNDFNSAVRNQIMSWFVENTTLEPPTSMVDNYADGMVEEAANQSAGYEKVDKDKLKDVYKSTGGNQIKWFLIQEELFKIEAVEISDEALEARIIEQIEKYKDRNPGIKKHYKKPTNKKRLKDQMEIELLFEKLKEFTVIKETTKTTDILREERKKAMEVK